MSGTKIIDKVFEGHPVRIRDSAGEPWFVLVDICRALDVQNPGDVSARLDPDEKMTVDLIDRHSGQRGGAQRQTIINESGLYSVILRSRKPAARRFKKWVTAEVLPQIRRTGSYSAATALPNFADPVAAARAWADEREARDKAERTKAEIGSRREATAMATASTAKREANRLKVQLDRCQQYASVKRMQRAFPGREFKWRDLKAVSLRLGAPRPKIFDANYGNVRVYRGDVWRDLYGIDIPKG